MIAVTISNESYDELAEESIKRFRRFNPKIPVIHYRLPKVRNAFINKIEVCWMHSQQSQQVIFFDSDWWQIREYDFTALDDEDPQYFYAVRDPARLKDDERIFVCNDIKKYGLVRDDYFNTGLFVFSSRHKEVFEAALREFKERNYDFRGEQSCINWAVQKQNHPTRFLGPAFNFFFAQQMIAGQPHVKYPIAIHAAAYDKPYDKLTALRWAEGASLCCDDFSRFLNINKGEPDGNGTYYVK